jgi:hypothetical protein
MSGKIHDPQIKMNPRARLRRMTDLQGVRSGRALGAVGGSDGSEAALAAMELLDGGG